MDKIQEIRELKALLDEGAINDDEFNMLKREVLSKSAATNNSKSISPSSLQKKSNNINDKVKKTSHKTQKQKVNVSDEYQESNDYTATFFYIARASGVLLGIVFGVRYNSFLAFILITAFTIGLTYIIYRLVRKLSMRNFFLISLVVICIVLVANPIGSKYDYSSSNSSNSSSGTDLYCTKHNRAYNTQNAWGGCPDCVEEEWDKKVEDSRQHLIKKYD